MQVVRTMLMSIERGKPGFRKLKLTYLLLSLAVLLICGSYGWRLYTLFRDARINMPRPQVEKLIKDLRFYYSRTKSFPGTFDEINDLIWHTRPKPDYGVDGRQARTKNYYYFYTKIDNRKCAFWALPLGSQRHYASSYFLVISERVLKGLIRLVSQA
jgi:hypothetical protein